MLIVVIIGAILILLNVCFLVAIMYQKRRVRQREDNLRRRIKRFSDAGMIHTDSGPTSNEMASASAASKYCVSNDQPVCNHDDSEASDEDAASEAAMNEDNKVYVISTHHRLPYSQPLHPIGQISYYR